MSRFSFAPVSHFSSFATRWRDSRNILEKPKNPAMALMFLAQLESSLTRHYPHNHNFAAFLWSRLLEVFGSSTEARCLPKTKDLYFSTFSGYRLSSEKHMRLGNFRQRCHFFSLTPSSRFNAFSSSSQEICHCKINCFIRFRQLDHSDLGYDEDTTF